MSAKNVQVSKDGTTFATLPGSTADLNEDSATADDSVFGTTFTSTQPTLITWGSSSNGFYKGFPGYRATLKRAGSPTAFTDEAMTEDTTNGLYYITDRTKSLWDNTVDVVINDGASPVAASDIEYIDYLQGGVKFVSSYNPTGAITAAEGSFLGTSAICYAQSFTLTQSADTENVTDFCEAQDNGGYGVFKYNQQTVELSLEGFYNEASDYADDLASRDVVIVEINPDGDGKSVARGYFRATSRSQSGDTGSTETESATYTLAVPEDVARPFSWYHAATSSIPQAVRWVLDAWSERDTLTYRYKPEGATMRFTGDVLVSDCSLSSGVEEINDFSLDFQGTGALTKEAV